MLPLIWQVVLATCLSNYIHCGTIAAVNESVAQHNSVLCPPRNFREPLYLPHPTDCQKYYICDEGLPFLRQCQPGLHFNPSLKACDYPEKAGCEKVVSERPRGKEIEGDDLDGCPKENSQEPVLFPHPTDCSKFYMCDSGDPHLKTCQFGLHFNPQLKACDYPENAGCAEVVSERPRGRKIEDDDLEGCPRENSQEPVLFPHPTDCNKFYMCDSGDPHLKTCQFGLHFNPQIKACDYPENAGCAEVVSEKPRGKMIEDDDLDGCPKENSQKPVLFPHPTDCSKFYMCDSGDPHLKTCQFGLHFNPHIKACDYPENAGCVEVVSEKPRGRNIEDEDLDGCPKGNSQKPVLFPHPTDCSKFYMCDSGDPHLKTCQFGLHFNPQINACDFPENAGCAEVVSEKPRGRMIDDDDLDGCPEKNSKYPIFFPHPTDCNKFYICNSGTPHLKICQSGLHFNPKIKACDYPERAKCDKGASVKYFASPEETSMKAGFPSPYCPSVNGRILIFFRHPTNCSIYYMCSHGMAYEFVCPARLHFNLRSKVCDYEIEARCVINKGELWMNGLPAKENKTE